jgi:hypothetical protein
MLGIHAFCCRDEDSYGIAPSKIDAVLSAYRNLSHSLLIWPSPHEGRREGRKHETIDQLDRIASLMGTSRPFSSVVLPDTMLPYTGTYVFKREYSSCCAHVEFANMDDSRERRKILSMIRDSDAGNGYRWIMQEYVSLLRQWGEWRVFMIGREVKAIVLTKSEEKGWSWNSANNILPLEDLTFVFLFFFQFIF